MAEFKLEPLAGGDAYELGAQTVVGRKEDCDLVISEGHPSRRHAEITLEGDQVKVKDLGSANGTFVNGARISDEQAISVGDVVAFDQSQFRLVGPQAEAPATVIRSAPDTDRTVIRSVDDLKKELEAEAPPPPAPEPPAPAAPEPAPAPAAPAPAADAGPQPGSWAEPGRKAVAGTQIFSREELQAQVAQFSNTSDIGQPHLEVGTGGSAGKIIPLDAASGAGEWTIGSNPSRDIVFTDNGVSDFHAKVVLEGGRWRLVDQLSSNGSYINDSKVVTGYLGDGDRIKVGTVECAIRLPGGAAAGGSAASSGGGGGGSNGMKIGIAAGVGVVVLAAVAFFLLG